MFISQSGDWPQSRISDDSSRLPSNEWPILARRQFAIPALWQDGYYERVVRAHGMDSLVRYILNNPVRAGIVEGAEQYPFSGLMTGPTK
jgi:REP element-mobilizing transposase RayT